MRPTRRPNADMLRNFPIFVDLPASNLARARRWYEETLGLSPAIKLGPGLLYESGGIPFLIYPSGMPHAESTAASWIVDDLRVVMAELHGQGVEFEEYMMGSADSATVNGVAPISNGGSSAWFKDSEGNVLRVSQLPYGLSLGDLVAAGRPATRSRRI